MRSTRAVSRVELYLHRCFRPTKTRRIIIKWRHQSRRKQVVQIECVAAKANRNSILRAVAVKWIEDSNTHVNAIVDKSQEEDFGRCKLDDRLNHSLEAMSARFVNCDTQFAESLIVHASDDEESNKDNIERRQQVFDVLSPGSNKEEKRQQAVGRQQVMMMRKIRSKCHNKGARHEPSQYLSPVIDGCHTFVRRTQRRRQRHTTASGMKHTHKTSDQISKYAKLIFASALQISVIAISLATGKQREAVIIFKLRL